MTTIFAWICAVVAAVATLGAAYFFDKSAEERIAIADERASAANEKAGQANERAATLEKEAAEARLKLAELQQIAPRLLMVEDQSQIREALSAFDGQQAEIGTTYSLSGVGDIQSLTVQVFNILKAAGWKVGPPTAWGTEARPSGIIVITEPSDATSKMAASALVNALRKASITAELKDSLESGDPIKIAGVTIVIGTKQ